MELKDALDAYLRRDEWRAEVVWLRNFNDEANRQVLSNNLIASMIKNPRDITTSTQLLFCSRNLEHILDHTRKIAETIHYMVTGELFQLERRSE